MWKKTMMAALACWAVSVQADWTLDGNESQLTFLSDKNAGIVEQHHFQSFDAQLTSDGVFSASIDLASVETAIHIRNERMREMLFKVADYPKATLSGALDAFDSDAFSKRPQLVSIDMNLSLNGSDKRVSANCWVSKDAAGALYVLSAQPILIRAEDFALSAGIEALRAVAGLKTISQTVPVSINLRLIPST